MMQFLKTLLLISFFSPSMVFAYSSFAQRPDVKSFIQHMVQKHHFNEQKLASLFDTVKAKPEVIENVNHPIEKGAWKSYQPIFINNTHIAEGAQFRKKYHKILVQAEKKYRVPGSIIIATLGVETLYGAHSGGYRVLDSLCNISFNHQPRAAYFQQELEDFLLLTREQHLDPATLQGSYAGAIGAPQFMPSSYRYYAISATKKSHIDLIHNIPDAIFSVANYYHQHGWKTPHFVGMPVTVKGEKYLKLRNAKGSPIQFSSSHLKKYGITASRKVPKGYKVKLIELEGSAGKEFWLVFANFDVIKRYNASNLYAMSVFQLSRHVLTYQKQGSPF